MVHHGAGLRQITRDGEFVKKFIEDYQFVSLSLRERGMLDYAAKLTREPWNMVEDDVKALKKEGFTDVGILHVNQVAGYYAFVNRLADGLGVNWKASGKTRSRFCNNQCPRKIRQVGSQKNIFPVQYKLPPCHIVISGLVFISLIFFSNADLRFRSSLNCTSQPVMGEG